MGYSTIIFGIDLECVKTAIADHDTSVIASARKKDRCEFNSKMDDHDPTVGEALEAIIKSQKLEANHAHQYGYAFKLLCDTMGEYLPDEDMIGDLIPLKLQSPLQEFKCPIELPAIPNFPYISYLTAEEVKQESKRLSTLDLAFPGDEDIEEGREAYATCINMAAAKKLAVVTFYH